MLMRERLQAIQRSTVALILLITSIGIFMLYSAAGGNWQPWAFRQTMHLACGFVGLTVAACVDGRTWLRYAYVLYGASLFLLVLVEVMGYVGMGAQRWLHIASFNLQPSELMRITIVLALARFLYAQPLSKWYQSLVPFLLVALPIALVLRQPDLGTAMLLVVTAVTLCYMAGLSGYFIAGSGLSVLAMLPFLWRFLHPYQQKRLLIFWDPDLDPLKSGYHLKQAKIALGSGGLWGNGFLQGSQSHLHFLPEKQTDFVFTMFSEEWGWAGGVTLIALYSILCLMNLRLVMQAKHPFGRLVGIGLNTTLFTYVFVNIAMVTGLLPVVGIPLPYMSYGGTAMITLLLSQGIMFSVCSHFRHRASHML